jgi:hypothetical protein
MEITSLVVPGSVAFKPRALHGWALEVICDLDASCPNFLRHVVLASDLKRQTIYAAVAQIEGGRGILGQALGGQANIRQDDEFAQIARALIVLKPREILVALLGQVPDGLLGTLARLGPAPLSRRELYNGVFGVFADSVQRDRANLLRQAPGSLSEARIEFALALDPALLHPRVFKAVKSLDDLEQLHAALRLIRRTVSTATDVEIRRSVSELPGGAAVSDWAVAWLRRMDCPPAPPPIENDLELIPLYGSALEDAARRLRNCLGDRLPHAATGRDLYVEVSTPPGAVAELRRLSNGGWVLMNIWGPRNEPPDEELATRVRAKLEAAGVVCLEAATSQADLDHLTELFSAYDLSDWWPHRQRLRQRLQAMEEAA